jgi:hypothetical protein
MMTQRQPQRQPHRAAAAALLAAAVFAACAAQSPEERVAELRAGYTAELNSFQIHETPIAPPPVAATVPVEEATAGPPAAGPVVGDESSAVGDETTTAEPPPPAMRQDVLLDILIAHRGDETLPGLTLDVTQADAQQQEKASYRIWVDTSGIPAGSRGAVAHRLEDVDVAPGDGFHVEVRQAIPPEQRDQYRELDEAAAGAGGETGAEP